MHLCILAGGRSRRFGGSKLHLRIDGEPILLWQWRRLGGVCDGLRWLSVAPAIAHDDALPGAAAFDRWVVDPVAHAGPLAAVRAVLGAMPEHDGVVIVPADMPLVEPVHLRGLTAILRRRPNAALVMGRRCDERGRERIEPFPSAWRAGAGRRLLSQAMAAGVRGPSRLAGWPGVVLRSADGADGRTWFDVDVREHAAGLSQRLGRSVELPAEQTRS